MLNDQPNDQFNDKPNRGFSGYSGNTDMPAAGPWLRRLPGFTKSPAGLEWRIWKRLPRLLVWGTVLLGVPCLMLGLALFPDALGAWAQHTWWPEWPGLEGEGGRDALQWLFMAVGLLVFHWTAVLTLAIGCVIVMAMKGPAFVADGLALPEAPPGSPDHHR
jgi:hypothetical protein